jgi:spore maturation protein CgeB
VKILCVLGEHNYGNQARGAGYEYVNFLPALRNLGHTVSHFESFSRASYSGFSDMNRQLLQKVVADKPDLILFVLLGYEVWLETLELIRASSHAVLLNWSTDDSWKYDQFSRFVAQAFDMYVTTYEEATVKAVRDGHGNFLLSQWAASSISLQPPLSAQQCQYQVTFIGTCYGNRPQWVANLAAQGIQVECFGFGWPNGPVSAERIPQIIRSSVISLNFGDSGIQWKGLVPGRSRQIKARLFEVPGAGGFLMTETADGLAQYFVPDQEVGTFDGLTDLVEKIRHYLRNPEQRDRIALAGHGRTAREHTYEARFLPLLSAASGLPVRQIFKSMNTEQFEAIAKSHHAGPLLMWLRKIMLSPCVLLWGKARGPRAARRMLFEVSWRLVGRKTYTAVGWPGRLFFGDS